MPAQLVSLDDGPNILLDKPILLIGRHPECDILIDSRKISRRHCCIAEVGDFLVVRDLGSTNGIRINGVRVLEGRLKLDDQLTIGGHSYRVTWDLIPESSLESAPPKQNGKNATRRSAAFGERDNFDSCDEPIPLPEPMGPPRGRTPPHAEKYELAQSSEKDPSNSNAK